MALQILDYLSHHPKAQDTVDGIAEWWMLEQHIRHVIAQVKKAVEELLDAGLIEARVGRDGKACYRLTRGNRSKPVGRAVVGRVGKQNRKQTK